MRDLMRMACDMALSLIVIAATLAFIAILGSGCVTTGSATKVPPVICLSNACPSQGQIEKAEKLFSTRYDTSAHDPVQYYWHAPDGPDGGFKDPWGRRVFGYSTPKQLHTVSFATAMHERIHIYRMHNGDPYGHPNGVWPLQYDTASEQILKAKVRADKSFEVKE